MTILNKKRENVDRNISAYKKMLLTLAYATNVVIDFKYHTWRAEFAGLKQLQRERVA